MHHTPLWHMWGSQQRVRPGPDPGFLGPENVIKHTCWARFTQHDGSIRQRALKGLELAAVGEVVRMAEADEEAETWQREWNNIPGDNSRIIDRLGQ